MRVDVYDAESFTIIADVDEQYDDNGFDPSCSTEREMNMTFGINGYWNVYGCVNLEIHSKNVTFAVGMECDQEGTPCCPICGLNENVEFIDTDFLER